MSVKTSRHNRILVVKMVRPEKKEDFKSVVTTPVGPYFF